MTKSPQLENGYTSTANELLEAECRVKMSGSEWQVYQAIKRLTYGWGKKSDRIAYSQLSKLTGLPRNRVFEAVKSLEKRAMVVSRENGTHSPKTIGINKDFSRWELSRKNGISRKSGTSCTEKTVQNYPEKTAPPKKENNINKKSSGGSYEPPKEAVEAARELGRKIYKHDPKNIQLQDRKREETFKRWAKDIDYLNRIDGVSWPDVYTVIDWCQKDPFWQTNILSGKKLRAQFDTLRLKMNQDTQGGRKSSPRASAGSVAASLIERMTSGNNDPGTSTENSGEDRRLLPGVDVWEE